MASHTCTLSLSLPVHCSLPSSLPLPPVTTACAKHFTHTRFHHDSFILQTFILLILTTSETTSIVVYLTFSLSRSLDIKHQLHPLSFISTHRTNRPDSKSTFRQSHSLNPPRPPLASKQVSQPPARNQARTTPSPKDITVSPPFRIDKHPQQHTTPHYTTPCYTIFYTTLFSSSPIYR